MKNIYPIVTFNDDYQLNDQENYVMKGQQVEISPYPIFKEGFTRVSIKNAFDFYGNPIEVNENVWFSNVAFEEYKGS